MATTGTPSGPGSWTVRMPRWTALVVWPVLLPLVHAAVPWDLSRLATRHGWAGGRPGPWNLAPLPLVVAGFAGILWCLVRHYRSCPPVVEASWSKPPYLLTEGPYRWSRNPMYVSALTIWSGWAGFYGSLPVATALLALAALLALGMVPAEERVLEARFGEEYRRYKQAVPRWLGRARA